MVIQGYTFVYAVQNGHIKRITDQDIELPVFEISGTNIINNYIAFPAQKNQSMRIKFPVLVLLVKNVENALFSWISILDSKLRC